MDGNYSRCLPRRLARTTGMILLDVSTATSVLRYVGPRNIGQFYRTEKLGSHTDQPRA